MAQNPKTIFVIVNKINWTSQAYTDLTQAAVSLGWSSDKLRRHMKELYYEDKSIIVVVATLYPSRRGNKAGFGYNIQQ